MRGEETERRGDKKSRVRELQRQKGAKMPIRGVRIDREKQRFRSRDKQDQRQRRQRQ